MNIFCQSWGCSITETFATAVQSNPYPMLDDSARMEFATVGSYSGMKISRIDTREPTGELLDALLLQNDDLIIGVDDMPLTSVDELKAIADHLLTVTQTEVDIRRGSNTISYTYVIAVSSP